MVGCFGVGCARHEWRGGGIAAGIASAKKLLEHNFKDRCTSGEGKACGVLSASV